MGNRAVIATKNRDLALYLHWNGGRDSVEAFLKYCDLREFRSPDVDDYGWARFCQVVSNFMGASGLSVGIMEYSTDEQMASLGADNGVYIIEGWEIVDRIYPWEGFEEQDEYDLWKMVILIDSTQPDDQRLGGYLYAKVVPVSSLEVGDMVYMRGTDGIFKPYMVEGFGTGVVNGTDVSGIPYVGMYTGYMPACDNINNYVRGESCRAMTAR